LKQGQVKKKAQTYFLFLIFLYAYKAIENSGYGMIDFELVHRELDKPNVTLSLLHYE
jgi:hypothetical protein